MKQVSFTIFGNPAHKRRPRSTARNGFVKTYSDPEQVEDEATVSAIAMQHRPAGGPMTGPVGMTMEVFSPIPRSWPAWKREAAEERFYRPTGKPDFDNIAKLYSDAFNGIIWIDDSQIVDGTVELYYSSTPRVEFLIHEFYEPQSAADWKAVKAGEVEL